MGRMTRSLRCACVSSADISGYGHKVMRVDLTARVRDVIDANRYMTIASADAHGDPWVSPVYCASTTTATSIGCRHLRSPIRATSRCVPRSALCRSTLALTEAVVARSAYLKATAVQVNGDEIEHTLTIYPGPVERGGIVTADELRAPTPYRLYRTRATEYLVLCHDPKVSTSGTRPVRGRSPHPSRVTVLPTGVASGRRITSLSHVCPVRHERWSRASATG